MKLSFYYKLLLSVLAFVLSAKAYACENARLYVEDKPLCVEVATTPEALQKGLMFRTSMPQDAGMLFLFAHEKRAYMWMKNTFLSLDMLFIAADGRITKIVPHTEPESLDIIASDEEVSAVLELNAGTSEKLGFQTGMYIKHPFFEAENK